MRLGTSLRAGLLVAAAAVSGCMPPDRLEWDAESPVISPAAKGPYGAIRVETPQGNGYGDDVERHHGFFLYAEDGRYIDRFPNEYALPIEVRPGKYIVLGDGLGGLRRVQVEVKENMTTHVRLEDLKTGKEIR